ncbi:MAG: tripartite tricarboxylate transporter TctB family protein [Candidatus Rokubacteria bacterium]|nr:tripartite tricarboxylate transporter TctB family protein [Candidatus Rokubacteria bacterium]
MKRALVVTGALGVVLAALYLVEARRYSWGTIAQPGPGLYPVLVGCLLILGSVGIALEATLRPTGGHIDWPVGRARWRLMAILLPSLAYVLLLRYLGHPVAGTLLTLAVLHAMGMRRWPVKIVIALAVGGISHYVFTVVLGVPLPAGFWSR